MARAILLLLPEVPMSDVPLSFNQMCARFDVTPRTLRYYE